MSRQILLSFLLFTLILTAQPTQFPLRSLAVKGNKTLKGEPILQVAALPLNKPAGKAEFEAARDRLLATGMFDTIGFQYGPSPDGKGVTGVFDVVEIPTMFPVEFDSLGVSPKDVDAYLRKRNPLYGPKLPPTTTVLEAYQRQIEQFLASQNQPMRVKAEVVSLGNDEYKILFRSQDAVPSVSFVTFTGNKAISSTTLQNAINNVAFGSTFTKDHFRQLLENQIRPLYDARGLVRVSFPNFTTEPDPKVKGVMVHVTVEEGPVYQLRKVTLTGAEQELLPLAKIKTGVTVNFDEVHAGQEKIKAELKREGYLDVQDSEHRVIDDQARAVDVVLQFDPGPQYVFGKLTISGLDLQGEPAVRKLWGLGEGKPFNPKYPDYFLSQIRQQGLFDGLGETKAVNTVDDQLHVVNVTLMFGKSPAPKPRKRPGQQDEDPAQSTKPGPPWN